MWLGRRDPTQGICLQHPHRRITVCNYSSLFFVDQKNVLITVTVPELSAFTKHFYADISQQTLSGLHDAIIRIVGVFPDMSRDEQIELFSKNMNVAVGVPGEYRMHVGTDIQTNRETTASIELPVSVLHTPAIFQKEVIARLRVVIGAPSDN